ncbi:hypothetical protein GCM10020218_092430 [Dactylosporangium vinaceum]
MTSAAVAATAVTKPSRVSALPFGGGETTMPGRAMTTVRSAAAGSLSAANPMVPMRVSSASA